jgi:hypothetical protein
MKSFITLAFWFQKQLSAKSTFQFHFINILFHSINSFLVFKILRNLLGAKKSLLVATIFAVHPVHVESVAGIVGRADILYSFFVLAGILFAIKPDSGSFLSAAIRCLSTSSLCFVAIFFKELGIVLIPLTIILEAILKHKLHVLPFPGCDKPLLLIFKISIFAIAFFSIVWFRLYLVKMLKSIFFIPDGKAK